MFTEKEILDLIQAEDLAVSYLTDDEREILEKIDGEKDKLVEKLGRSLSDDEAERIEKSVEGGWDVLCKISDLVPRALNQVRSKASGNIQ
ncbi:hypothetical protein A2V56_00885 [Candidatus Woesebacteria bacterium RBG_19FT_COMBO_42_9]|nr:MAG: hypothetical protein A2V56_00885 [Candidatus Woesebacteria bacterium RBG_19FT_COMBO_42_9]